MNQSLILNVLKKVWVEEKTYKNSFVRFRAHFKI